MLKLQFKVVCIFLWIGITAVYSQERDTVYVSKNDAPLYALVTTSKSFLLAPVQVYDDYLSPLYYSGEYLSFRSDRQRYFSPYTGKWSSHSKYDVGLGLGINPAGTSSMILVGGNLSWGAHYHFDFSDDFRLYLGPSADIDLAFKMVGRNVNNPVNVDMAANINASVILQYKIPARRRNLHFQAEFQLPVIGYMFVPERGASYYEMFDLGAMKNTGHFTFLHNKNYLLQRYTIDIPAQDMVWRIGIEADVRKHTANDMVFSRSSIGFIVGWTFDFKSFGGRNNPAPSNFRSVKL